MVGEVVVSKRRAVIAALLVVCLLASWAAVARASAAPSVAALVKAARAHAQKPTISSQRRLYVPGEVLVEFRAGVRAPERGRVAADLGAQVVRLMPASASAQGGVVLLMRSGPQGAKALIAKLKADPAVVAVSRNCWRRVMGAPDDPGFAAQWGLLRVGAGDAWTRTTGADGVVVADVDTGVDLRHPDLAANIWRNGAEIPGNGIDDDGNGYVDDVYGIDTADHDVVPMDDFGHGTHIAGIMAAVTGNGTGVAGLAPGVKVMALKCMDWRGWGTDAMAIECIDYVIHQKQAGVNVVAINASWGATPGDLFLRNAIDRAGAAGIIFCAAAGNDGESNDEMPMYPASYDCPNIITVAATQQDDALTYFSNYGDCGVDIGAPGLDILSTLPNGDYDAWAGTSMATPFVTATVALCASLYPAETAQQRVARILDAARPVESLTGKVMTGGVLDVPAALGMGDPAADHTAPVTVALDAGGPARSVRTSVQLFASDGAGGSGVARTEYRVGGGDWTAGDRAPVPAPRGKVVVHIIDYRSVDKAGNTEDAKTVQVTTDTTSLAHGRPVKLTTSPVTGWLGRSEPYRAYSVRLVRGESFKIAVDNVDWTGGLMLFGQGARGPVTDGAGDIAFRVTKTGVYTLIVLAFEDPTRYSLSYVITPKATDVVPPELAIHGPRGAWHNTPVAVTATAVDDKWGSGLRATEVSLDDGLTWQPGGGAIVDAPADHSNDGFHHVLARATDAAGNVSRARGRWIGIDTEGPSTSAWVEESFTIPGFGHIVIVGFRTHDIGPNVWCSLAIRSVKADKVVYRRRLGWYETSDMQWWTEDPFDEAFVRLPHLPKGTYKVYIAGKTHDVAGNHWASAECTKPLVIK
jgi:subtilisin family serine protease